MDFIKDVTKKVASTAKVAVKKSSDLVEITKLNINIGAEKDKISKIYTQIGKTVYDSFEKGEEVPANFKDLCERVLNIKENIKKMERQILQLKNIKICPSCGAELETDVAFCSRCGAKQEMPCKRLIEDVQNCRDSQNIEAGSEDDQADKNVAEEDEASNVAEEEEASNVAEEEEANLPAEEEK
ncbi:MAG: zinc ribbon domain-containing protein [Clostridium sp.]|jgi:ribosomal protein L40E|nr:zinc ribbon domain-containing protein [Clostridium sp.]